MYLIIAGLNHKSAPLEVREKISFPKSSIHQALKELKRYEAIKESLILSTCNRVEIYAAVDDIYAGEESIKQFLCDYHGIDKDEFESYFYTYLEDRVLKHLFRVTSSLDSMVVGEPQIFGQVKRAYREALESECLGYFLDKVFRKAFSVGKQVRTETFIGKNAVSLSSVAVELAKEVLGTMEERKILIVGAGKMGEKVVKRLMSKGVKEIFVSNRTSEKARALADLFNAKSIEFKERFECMEEVDMVLSSTGAPHCIFNKDQVSKVMLSRQNKPLLLIDIAVPRDIRSDVKEIENVTLYSIDDLKDIADKNLSQRLGEAEKAEAIVAEELERCLSHEKDRAVAGALI